MIERKTGRVAIAALCVMLIASAAVFAQDMTSADFVAEANKVIKTITVNQAKQYLDTGGYVFIDVREPNETQMGFIPGAMLVPRGLLEFQIASKVPDKNAKIVVYCKSGGRGALATHTLVKMGYKNAVNVAGGFTDWMNAGFPIDE